MGQVPVSAWVARASAEPLSEDAFKAWLKDRVLPYQVPVRILQLEEMPRTPSMKVSQPALRALFERLPQS